MKQLVIVVIVLGILGGIMFFKKSEPVQYIQQVADSVTPELPKEPTAEELLFAEKMKIKEQEARLETKRDVLKEQFETGSAEYESKIAALKAEFAAYASSSQAEIKTTEAELASFIKATSMSKN